MRRSITRFSTILITLYLTVIGVHANLDPTFGSNGRSFLPLFGNEDTLASFLVPDGKFLVLSRHRWNPQSSIIAYRLSRINSNGTPDETYYPSGGTQLPIFFESASVLDHDITGAVRQADGKIVVVGYDNGNGMVLRFREDGGPDTSFSGDGVHRPNINQADSDIISDVIQQPDGKLVAVGYSRLNGASRLFLIRYQPNGELDLSFGDQSGFIVHPINITVAAGLARQSNGSYIVLDRGETDANGPKSKVYRFNANGSFDNSFSSPLFGSEDATKLLVDSNDRVLVGGSPFRADHLFRFQRDLKLTRLNAGGGLDVTFGTGGTVVTDVASGMWDILSDILELPDGSIAIAAMTLVARNRSPIVGNQLSVLTVGTTGTLTGRYLVTGLNVQLSETKDLLRQPDGKLVVTGSASVAGGTIDVLISRFTGVPLTTNRFRAIPFEFTSYGSGPVGVSQPAVFRPSTTRWYASPFLASGVQFGLAGDVPVAGDYFGDWPAEIAVFRPSTATWFISKNYSSFDFATIQWGVPGDIPAQYDYDGDGKYDVAVFRPSDGNWYIRQSSDNSPRFVHWGADGDKPVTGDYDGDGLGDQAVWRPSNGVWYINRSSDGQAQIAAFGLDGDVPVQEDYDGDLKTDIAVFRPSTGVWYIWRSSDNGFTIVHFGLPGDVPVPGDYDGDRKMDVSVFRPSNSVWYRLRSSDGSFEQFTWGTSGDIPVQGRN